MADFWTDPYSLLLLNHAFRSEMWIPPDTVELALFTQPPTKAGDDGIEVAGGGYARPVLTFGPAVPGTVGRTGQIVNDGDALFRDMPVASTALLGFAACNGETGEVMWVNNSWTPGISFIAGQNLLVPRGSLTFFTKDA